MDVRSPLLAAAGEKLHAVQDALHCEGVIALSPEYTAWPDQDLDLVKGVVRCSFPDPQVQAVAAAGVEAFAHLQGR